MDIEELLKAIENIQALGDTLDNAGGGIYAMSGGQHTTREVCKKELGFFLLYIGDGCDEFNDGQAAMINLLLGDGITNIPADKMKELARGIEVPSGKNNLTLRVFSQADTLMAQQKDDHTKQLSNILVTMYDSIGGIMVVLSGNNPVSQIRYEKYMTDLRNSAGLPQKPKEPVKSAETLAKRSGSTAVKTSTGRKITSTEKGIVPAPAEKASATTKGRHTEVYNDIIKFILPAGYAVTRTEKSDGTEGYRIFYGEYTDDNGNPAYEFFC